MRPSPSEHAPFYGGYVALVPEDDVLGALAQTPLADLAETLRPDALSHRYATGKWSAADVIRHVADTERIFSTRALRFARGDETPLPGFDQNTFAAAAHASGRDGRDLAEEFRTVRAATLSLLRSFSAEAWDRTGTASGHRMSVRAAAFVIVGHERHHLRILHERYLGGS